MPQLQNFLLWMLKRMTRQSRSLSRAFTKQKEISKSILFFFMQTFQVIAFLDLSQHDTIFSLNRLKKVQKNEYLKLKRDNIRSLKEFNENCKVIMKDTEQITLLGNLISINHMVFIIQPVPISYLINKHLFIKRYVFQKDPKSTKYSIETEMKKAFTLSRKTL